MKAVRVTKPYELKIETMDIPYLKNDTDVLIKIKAAGICGSDVHIYHGTSPVATYPRIIGHEMVGVIEQVGSGVSRVKAGQRVIIDQIVNCGQCYACKIGRGNVCNSLKVRGVHIDGGFCEYMVVDEKSVHVLPENISDEIAVLLEPLSIAVQSVSRADITGEDTLVILGAGALGNSLLKVAKLSGAKIIVVDILEERLKEAENNGADYTINTLESDLKQEVMKVTDGYGATVSIDAACTKDSLAQLIEITGNAGRVITMGFSEQPTPVPQLGITAKELDIRGSRLQNNKFPVAIKLLSEEKINMDNFISHVIPFTDVQKAFDMIDNNHHSVKKIILTFN